MKLFINDYQTHYDVIVHERDDPTHLYEWCQSTGIHGQWEKAQYFGIEKVSYYPKYMKMFVVYFNRIDRDTMLMIKLGLQA